MCTTPEQRLAEATETGSQDQCDYALRNTLLGEIAKWKAMRDLGKSAWFRPQTGE
jgi:hypothetical protein